jgi:hypothetical protein
MLQRLDASPVAAELKTWPYGRCGPFYVLYRTLSGTSYVCIDVKDPTGKREITDRHSYSPQGPRALPLNVMQLPIADAYLARRLVD